MHSRVWPFQRKSLFPDCAARFTGGVRNVRSACARAQGRRKWAGIRSKRRWQADIPAIVAVGWFRRPVQHAGGTYCMVWYHDGQDRVVRHSHQHVWYSHVQNVSGVCLLYKYEDCARMR
jgi:hypothetical protein